MKTDNIADLPEKELIVWLIEEGRSFWNAFDFVLEASTEHLRYERKLECYLAVSRPELGLEAGRKPGDIDVLLIPVVNGQRLTADCIAVEVKKLPIPTGNRGRSPSSYGRAQVIGASKDGFPFVGLLHIAIVERPDVSQYKDIPVIGEANSGVWLSPEELAAQNRGSTIPVDPDFDDVISRTVGRLKQFDWPAHIGFYSHVIQTNVSGDLVQYTSSVPGRSAARNPNVSENLLAKLDNLEREPDHLIMY